MAAGFIWLHLDGHVRVPRLLDSLLDDVHAAALPVVDEKLPGAMLSQLQAECCLGFLVRCLNHGRGRMSIHQCTLDTSFIEIADLDLIGGLDLHERPAACLQGLQRLQMPTDACRRLRKMHGSAFDFWGAVSSIRGTIPFQNPVHSRPAHLPWPCVCSAALIDKYSRNQRAYCRAR